MNLDNFNNLIELFFYQTEKQKPESIFLEWLNPNNRKNFTWAETKQNIFKLSKKIKKIEKGAYSRYNNISASFVPIKEHIV